MIGNSEATRTNEKRALRINTFANTLDISVSLARQWMRSGQIRTFKLGKLVMVPASEVDRILAEGSREPAA